MNDPRGHRVLPYHPDAYDEHFALRISVGLWLVMLYTVHPQILLLIVHLPPSGAELDYLRGLVDVYALLATLPAMLVLIAAVRRRPAAGAFLRGVWRRGPRLLVATLVVHLARSVLDTHGPWTALRIGADLVAATVLLGVPRIRDTFADFPKPPL